MMRLMALIIAIFAVITTAWAGDSWVDYPTCPDDGKAYEYQAETHELNPSIPENVLPTNEITDILERCLEFVDDRARVDDLSTSVYSTPAVLYLHSDQSRQRDKIKDTEDTLQRQKEALKRMERETALRREIERATKILKGDSK